MSGYFLYHSIGTYHGKSEQMAEELGRFSSMWSAEDDGQWPAALQARHRFIESWSQLIDAPANSLTTTENVTTALYSIMGSLPLERIRGQRFLIAADCFPSLHFLLNKLADRFGFTLDTVSMRPGETWVRDEDFIDRWQDDVGIALLTFVTSTASHRCDIDVLTAHGRRMGTIIGADITQGIGVQPFSVAITPVDFVISTSLKWLCGTPGAGILQVSPDLMADCAPELRGWFSQENPFSWDLERFAYAPDIRRFDHGTPSILSNIASQPGLDWVARTGIDAIQAQNLVLTQRIIDWARDHDWAMASPVAASSRGGSVMLNLPETVNVEHLLSQLRAQELYCDARGHRLRISPGMVTDVGAVDSLCRQLDQLVDWREKKAS